MIQENECTDTRKDTSNRVGTEEARSIDGGHGLNDGPSIADALGVNSRLELISMAADLLPIAEALAPEILRIYRQAKESGELREVADEVFGDLSNIVSRIDMANVKRNIEAINAYKAAGISETNAVALRCARYNRKLPGIKINMHN